MPFGVGSIVMDQRFKLKRINARQHTGVIEMTGTLSKAGAKTPAGAGGSASNADPALVVDAGSVTGEYVWDFEAGQLASAETRLELDTELDSPLGRMRLEQDMSSSVKRTNPRE